MVNSAKAQDCLNESYDQFNLKARLQDTVYDYKHLFNLERHETIIFKEK